MTEVYHKIIKQLNDSGVEYFTAEHGSAAEDSDHAMGYDIAKRPHHSGAKAIVVKGKRTGAYYHFVLPDDMKLDQKKVKEFIGERFSFASAEELKAVTDCVPGCVPPFGSAIGMKAHVNKQLAENEDIFFNAGSLTHSVRMKYKDYESVEKPEVVDLAVYE
jgi:Ala-tRNA(Pro) deacylase